MLTFVASCTNRKDILERKYYASGKLMKTIERISKDSLYCIKYYENGHKQIEGLLGRDSSFFGFCKEYYKDGKLKWRGNIKNGYPLLFSRPGFSIKKDIIVDIEGKPDTLIVGKSYGLRVYIEGVYPDAFLVKYSNRNEVNKNIKDPDLYPYIIKPQKIGKLEIIIQLMDDDGTFHREGDEVSVHIPVVAD